MRSMSGAVVSHGDDRSEQSLARRHHAGLGHVREKVDQRLERLTIEVVGPTDRAREVPAVEDHFVERDHARGLAGHVEATDSRRPGPRRVVAPRTGKLVEGLRDGVAPVLGEVRDVGRRRRPAGGRPVLPGGGGERRRQRGDVVQECADGNVARCRGVERVVGDGPDQSAESCGRRFEAHGHRGIPSSIVRTDGSNGRN